MEPLQLAICESFDTRYPIVVNNAPTDKNDSIWSWFCAILSLKETDRQIGILEHEILYKEDSSYDSLVAR